VTQPTAFAVTMLSWGLAQFSSGYNSAGETNNALEQVQVGFCFCVLPPLSYPCRASMDAVRFFSVTHGLATSIVALLCISVADGSLWSASTRFRQAHVCPNVISALWQNCR